MSPVILRFTLLLVLLYGPSDYYAQVPLRVVAASMLLRGAWLRSRYGWGLLTLLFSAAVAVRWFDIDNHQFLILYWVLTIYLAHAYPQIAPRVPTVARQLVGWTFFFAVCWKFMGGQYYDGTFWEYTLLVDSRVTVAAKAVGSMTSSMLERNRASIRELVDPLTDVDRIQIASSARIKAMSRVMSWLGVGVEAAVAALFLLPMTPGAAAVAKMRIWVMNAFLLTYVLLPVVGFAWILVILTMAQMSSRQDRAVPLMLSIAMAIVLMSGWRLVVT